MPPRPTISALAAALALAACWPGASQAPGLAYVDPPGQGWRLQRDPASTPARLVLDLVGPPGLSTRGVGFTIQAPPGLRFGTFCGGRAVNDAGAYDAPASSAGQRGATVVAELREQNVLQAGIYQRGLATPPPTAERILLQVAIEASPGARLRPGEPQPLGVRLAHVVLADLGGPTGPRGEPGLDGWPPRAPEISIAVGTLAVR